MKASRLTNEIFVAKDVPLCASNLIEASAGTGKTYSIAILVLRLLLETQINIKQILMVTFTKAAVAELEERIRLFVRTAFNYANQQSIEDATIKEIVDRSIENIGIERVRDLLKSAKLLLDETSVMTIHSFCQQSLNEFPFETNQLFGSETLHDLTPLIEEEVNKFWRAHITTLDPVLLGFLLKEKMAPGAKPKLSREVFKQFVSQELNGQRYLEYNVECNYSFSDDEAQKVLSEFLRIETAEIEYTEKMIQDIVYLKQELIERCQANAHTRKGLSLKVNDPEGFIATFKAKKLPKYIHDVFPDWVERVLAAENFQREKSILAMGILNKLYCLSIQIAVKNIKIVKEKNSVISFNDMILKLHNALTREDHEKLASALKSKYQAVFIDEFQDTDKLQYEIFKNAFGNELVKSPETIIFYIGDPKQSIYAWRQADLNTYFKASREVSNRYGMNQNFRSAENFIRAMNHFFLPNDDFDTFSFGLEKDVIEYVPVESPQPNRKGRFNNGQEEETPITLFEIKRADDIYKGVAAQIIKILEDDMYQIVQSGSGRRIQPSDIGVLVRTKNQGKKIKKELAKYGIPAITIDDSKVLQTAEAQFLYYLLNAFVDSNAANINKALLNPITGFTRTEIINLNHDEEVKKFKELGLTWQNEGIYATLMNFFYDYHIKDNLLDGSFSNGERCITNLFQLIEILHKVQESKRLSSFELIEWLKRGIEGMKMEGDEYEQRVESDMDAVEIVTIHKSKGLEYNIVFAPFLDLKSDNKHSFCSFKNSQGDYVFGISEHIIEEDRRLVERQLEQENRRLIYVAITRAVYKCYITRYTYYSTNTSLAPFVDAAKKAPRTELIDFAFVPGVERGYRYLRSQTSAVEKTATADNFRLKEEKWRKMSYTFLALKHPYVQKSNNAIDLEGYEHFVFKQLRKGNITGNWLHYLFENVDFVNSHHWEKQVEYTLARFVPKQLDVYKAPVLTLLNEVMHAKIEIGSSIFRLSDIPKEKRLTEMEFDFNVPIFDTTSLNALSWPESTFEVSSFGALEGIMNGKIDLFFEYNGLYYIADWKSNFLGDSIDDYSTDSLKNAMAENNYNLQYLIYTVAAKKYLESRLDDFSYERDFGGIIYLFLRGIRKNSNHGVFVAKPPVEKIELFDSVLSGLHT